MRTDKENALLARDIHNHLAECLAEKYGDQELPVLVVMLAVCEMVFTLASVNGLFDDAAKIVKTLFLRLHMPELNYSNMEQLKQLIDEGLKSGPDTPWDKEELIRLAGRDREFFAEMINNPPKPSKAAAEESETPAPPPQSNER